MKNIAYGIIGVLAICVGILFYQVQTLKAGNVSENSDKTSENTSEKSNVKPVVMNGPLPDARIAYINIDTLNENYLFIEDYVKVLKGRKLSIEAQLQSLTQKFQQDYEAAQQSAQAGIMPPAEMEAKKKELERQQREIQNKELQMDNLATEMAEKNDQLQRDVKEFLKRYNNEKYDYIMAYSNAVPSILLANPKLDITYQVLDALNTEYKNKKANQKK